ncbi:HlyD family secretion protein [Cetobacterium sp.]|uniref:HlyD family secretion protein n=1 Tax=Cetobacterium sp. TaxID=2071632 RepID=UPI003EE560A7
MKEIKLLEQLKKIDVKYLFGVGILALLFYFIADYIISKKEDKVYFGVLEVDKINISSELLGKIETVYIKDGDYVKKGQLLISINNKESRLKVENSELSVKSSENQLQKTLDGTREEQISSQKEIVKQLESQIIQGKQNLIILTSTYKFSISNLENKKKIYFDTKDLFEKKFESQYAFDIAKLNFESAQNQFTTAQNNLENGKQNLIALNAQKNAAEDNLRYLINGFSQRDIEADKLKIASSEKGLELTKIYAEKNTLTAPIDGIVETVNLKIGEVINPGIAAVTMLDNNNIWTKIYIPEKLLPSVKLGQKVKLNSDFIDKEYDGEIIYIASDSEFTPMNIVTKKDRLKLVYELKIKLLNNDDKLKSGMLVGVDLGL